MRSAVIEILKIAHPTNSPRLIVNTASQSYCTKWPFHSLKLELNYWCSAALLQFSLGSKVGAQIALSKIRSKLTVSTSKGKKIINIRNIKYQK